MTRDPFEDFLQKHTVSTHPPLCPEILTLEARDLVPLWEEVEKLAGSEVEPPFWAYSWPGGQALARYVLDCPAWVRGKVVLDLGCGNGIAGIAAAKAGARRVIACDVDPSALRMTEIHASRNQVAVEGEPRDLLEAPPPVPPVEVILAGDLFYAREMARRVEGWLVSAAACRAEILVGDPGRAYLPAKGLDLLETYQVPVSPEVESVEVRQTRVFKFAPRDSAPSRKDAAG